MGPVFFLGWALLGRGFGFNRVLGDLLKARMFMSGATQYPPTRDDASTLFGNPSQRAHFNSNNGAILSQINQPPAARGLSCNSDCFQSARGADALYISALDQRIYMPPCCTRCGGAPASRQAAAAWVPRPRRSLRAGWRAKNAASSARGRLELGLHPSVQEPGALQRRAAAATA